MTGLLTLSGNPSAALHAASKQYVDAFAAPLDALAYNGMQINGSMEVSQERGTTASTFGGYVCDGWMQNYAGTMTVSAQQAPTGGFAGFPYYLAAATTVAQASLGANDFHIVWEFIEGWRIARLAWGTASAKPVTIAFWTWHHRTGLYSGTIRNSAFNRSYVFTYTQTVADVAQYNVITIPGDTLGTWAIDNTRGIALVFSNGAGATFIAPSANTWLAGSYHAAPGQINGVAATSDVFRIAGVVVLPGIYAPTAAQSALIMRPYDQELVTCQRYYQKFGKLTFSGNTGAGGLIYHSTIFQQTMRAVPTIVISSPAYYNMSGLAVQDVSANAVVVQSAMTAAGSGWSNFDIIADSRL